MKALIVVDPQNDFCTGGALAIPEGEQIIPIANKLFLNFKYDIAVLTQDWHPATHASFASNSKEPVFSLGTLNGKPQVWWPDHCVWDSNGAKFHKDLLNSRFNVIIRKGMNHNVDSYSGFYDNDGRPTGLGGYLINNGVKETYIMGLATNYCVKFTALDSVKDNFITHLIIDGCRGINVNPDDSTMAVKEMEEVGIILTHSRELISK